MTRRWAFLAAMLAVSASTGRGAIPSFQGLGDLPGGKNRSRAFGVSADGSCVVGESDSALGNEAFYWNSDEGMVPLGDLPGGKFFSQAYGVSADGSVIVGRAYPDTGTYEAFRWTRDGGIVGLGRLAGGTWSIALDVSADGSVVVGQSTTAGISQGTIWTASGGLSGVSDSSAIVGVSDGGTVVAGNRYGDYSEPFIWSEETGRTDLGHVRGTFNLYDTANGISADGLVVVGRAHVGGNAHRPFRWTQATGMVSLGDPPGGPADSRAYGVSADGSVIVGEYEGPLGNTALVWDATHGLRDLAQVLTDDYQLDLTGWHLRAAWDISNDGTVIVGSGYIPGGDMEAWIATIPEPATLSLLVFGGLGLLLRLRKG